MSYIVKTNYADRSNYGSYRDVSKIKYIVWHYTGNDGDSDESNGNYFKRKNLKASAHYFVDDDSVTVSVPDTYVSYSVGGSRYSDYKSTGGASLYKICTNTNSVNVELCDVKKNGKFDVTDRTLENAIILTRELMKKYNIPIDRVVRHFDCTGKKCPSYYVNNNTWISVKARISEWNTDTDTDTNSNSTTSNVTSKDIIALGQQHANNFVQSGLVPDGIRGENTKRAGVKILQHALNCDYNSNLSVDGMWGAKSRNALGNHYVKRGDKQFMVTALEILLMLNGYDSNGVECPGTFGAGLERTVRCYQADNGLIVDGKAGSATFLSLIS